MGEDCDWTLLVPEDLVGRVVGEGGEETDGLREGEGLRGEDEGAPQGEAGEVSHVHNYYYYKQKACLACPLLHLVQGSVIFHHITPCMHASEVLLTGL